MAITQAALSSTRVVVRMVAKDVLHFKVLSSKTGLKMRTRFETLLATSAVEFKVSRVAQLSERHNVYVDRRPTERTTIITGWAITHKSLSLLYYYRL